MSAGKQNDSEGNATAWFCLRLLTCHCFASLLKVLTVLTMNISLERMLRDLLEGVLEGQGSIDIL